MDWTQEILDGDGEVLMDRRELDQYEILQVDEDGTPTKFRAISWKETPTTLRMIVCRALRVERSKKVLSQEALSLTDKQVDNHVEDTDKSLRRIHLAMKIASDDAYEPTDSEIMQILQDVELFMGPLVFYRVLEILAPDELKKRLEIGK